jgi:transcriptional regulator with XRE-family HTH domain
MEWEQIRAHYVRAFHESGRTQQQVAAAAGLTQNTISKLMANRREGPVVGTLLRAITGLGLLPSIFFTQIEDEEPPTPDVARAVPGGRHVDDEDLARLRRFGLALRAFEQTLVGATPRRRKRRAKRVS